MDTTRTWKSVVGGILSVVAGAMHIFGWLGIGLYINSAHRIMGTELTDPRRAAIWLLLFPLLLLSIVAVIGGIAALNRKAWGLALAGSICAIFSPMTWFLGVLATIFIALSRNEFVQRLSPASPPPQPPPPPPPPSQIPEPPPPAL